jgi:hypothetical protein
MLIQGIRSFDPNSKAVIEFYKPITLIVGQNGAGKTVRFPVSRPPVSRPQLTYPASIRLSLNVSNMHALATLLPIVAMVKHLYMTQVLLASVWSRLKSNSKYD